MSIAAVQAFREKVNANPSLQAELGRIKSEQGWLELGKAHGFIFSADELKTVIEEVNSEADADLNDFELSMIAAGCNTPSWWPWNKDE